MGQLCDSCVTHFNCFIYSFVLRVNTVDGNTTIQKRHVYTKCTWTHVNAHNWRQIDKNNKLSVYQDTGALFVPIYIMHCYVDAFSQIAVDDFCSLEQLDTLNMLYHATFFMRIVCFELLKAVWLAPIPILHVSNTCLCSIFQSSNRYGQRAFLPPTPN